MVSVSTLLTASAIFCWRPGTHLQRCSWHDSFWSFVAILRGSDDGDIRFGRDVVATLPWDTSAYSWLTMICRLTGHSDQPCIHGRSFVFPALLAQETQIAGGGQGNDLIIAGDFASA